ncbi:MAG: ABC transporter permease subunit [Acidimicrobiia bacterium]
MRLDHVRLVARRELSDLRRDRSAWRAMLLQPLLLAAALTPVVFAVEVGREERSTRRYSAVVEGEPALVERARHHLEASGLRVRDAQDATLTVAGEDAHVGVLLERGEDGEPLRVVVEQRVASEPSRRATAVALRAVEEFRLSLVRDALLSAGADPDAARPFEIEIQDVTSASPEATRLTVAAALPSLIAIQLFSLVSLAQQRLGSAKDRRVLEPLLVLPLARSSILAGAAVAAVVTGLLGSAVVLLPVAGLLVAGVGALSTSLAAPLSVLAALALEVALLSSVFAAAGLYVGARSASGANSNTVSAVVQTALIMVLTASVFVAEADVTIALAAAPVIGALVVAREGAADGLVLLHVGASVLSHLGLAVLLLRAAGRRLGDRRSVLRPSG